MSSSLSINPEPITKKGIQEHNPEIECIYTGKKGNPLIFRPIAEKKGGTALGTIFEKAHSKLNSFRPCSQWLGKVGMPSGRLRNDPSTIKTRTKKELNLDTIREKFGYDLYQELGRGLFKVPKTRLSLQPMIDQFTLNNALAAAWANQGIDNSLRVMSRYMTGYLDFAHAKIQDGDSIVSFIDYLRRYHRPPSFLITPEGKQVPLKGFMALIAVGRVLADTDIIGGSGGNAGFIWIKDAAGQIIEAQAVKIDPGEVFKFKLEEPEEGGRIYPSANWFVNTIARKEGQLAEGQTLQDLRDLQIAQCDDRVALYWNALIPEQQREFLGVFLNSRRYLQAEEILKYLFYRDGKFNRNEQEKISIEIAEQFQKDMQAWLSIQLDIYKIELEDFQKKYPEEILRIQYIDQYGQIPLPTSDETFPIRELYTQLVLVEYQEQKNKAEKEEKNQGFSRNPELPERDSLSETFDRLWKFKTILPIEELFSHSPKKDGRTSLHKVLLLGSAGIGKSTFCQKISHDWASGRLWKEEYQAVYWISLRKCNAAVNEGGLLAGEKNLERWLAKAIGHLVLGQEFLVSRLEEQIRKHKQKILILFDGYDEATSELASIVDTFLADPELNIFLTSRPGVTSALHSRMDRIAENIGFSDDQVSAYAERFFKRGPQGAIHKSNKVAFLAALKFNPHFYGIAHVPLHSQMLCALWEKGKTGFPSTFTELYEEMIQLLLHMNYQRAGKNSLSSEEQTRLIENLGPLALRGLESGKIIIPERELANLANMKESLLLSGLLKESQQGGSKEYYFLHLTFQEYLAARFIANSSLADQRRFVLEYRYKPQLQLTLSFLAGMIAKKGRESAKTFFGWLHSTGGDITGLFQFELMIRCLNECSDSSLHQWVSETYRFEDVLPSLLKISKDESRDGWLIRRNVERFFQIYPIGLQEIWHKICKLLGDQKKSEFQKMVIQFLTERGQNTPLQFHEQIVKELLHIKNPSLLLAIFNKNDPSLTEIKAIIMDLSQIGKVASGKTYRSILSAILEALRDSNPDVRCKAAEALEEIIKTVSTEQIAAVEQALLKALKDPYPAIRWRAAKVFREIVKAASTQQILAIRQALLEALKDQDRTVRWEAAETLGEIGKAASTEQIPVILQALIKVVKDPNPRVRWKVAEALAKVVKSTSEEQILAIVQVLLEALKDPDQDVRCKAAEALEGAVKAASAGQISSIRQALIKAVKDPDANLMAAKVLGEVVKMAPVEQSPAIVRTLLEALKSPNSRIRCRAIEALEEMIKAVSAEQIPAILQALIEALKDPYSDIRRRAIKALEEMIKTISAEQIPAILQALMEVLKDPNVDVKCGASLALRTALRFASVQIILEALRDPNPDIRWDAAQALGEVGKTVEQVPAILLALLKVIEDPVKHVCSIAAEALVKVAKFATAEQIPAVLQVLLEALKKQDRHVRSIVAEALVKVIKDTTAEQVPVIMEILLEDLKDSNPNVRYKAAGALIEMIKIASTGQIFTILQALLEALKDPHLSIRRRAIEALKEMIAVSAEQIPTILKALLETLRNPDPPVRYAAAEALGEVVKFASVEQISTILQALLGALKDPIPIETLKGYPIAAFKHLNSMYRGNAIKSLIEVVKVASAEQISTILKALFEALKDPDANWKAKDSFNKLVYAIPAIQAEQISVFLQALLDAQQDPASKIERWAVNSVFENLSIKKFLKIFAVLNWAKLAPIFINQIISRNSPLFIQEISNISHLCVVENNQIIQQQITPEQVQYFKTWSRTEGPLRPYTSCYLK